MNYGKRGLFVTAALLCAAYAACKGGDDAAGAGDAATTHAATLAGAPAKEGVLARLRDIQGAFQAGDFDRAATQFAAPVGHEASEIPKQLQDVARRVSAAGIEALAKAGKYGPAKDLLPAARLTGIAERFGVASEQCWALTADPAEVVLCRFKDGVDRFVRLNRVADLAPPPAAAPAAAAP